MASSVACWGGLRSPRGSAFLFPFPARFLVEGCYPDSPPFFAVFPGVPHHSQGLCSGSLWSPCHQFGGTAYGRAPAFHALPGIRLPAPLPALGSFPSSPPFCPRLGAGRGAWHLFWRAGRRSLSLRGAPESPPPAPFGPLPASSILEPNLDRTPVL
ncbi:hypothetical protein ES705_28839 [subsurface metagenome]